MDMPEIADTGGINYITASSIIGDHTVYKNGKPLFVNKGIGLPDFLLSVYQHYGLQYARFFKMDNLSKLGWLATEILLNRSLRAEDYLPEETAIVLANSSSSLDTDLKYFESITDIPSPSLFVYTLPNIMIGEICIRNNFKGENAFFLQDSFDRMFIEQYVGYLLNSNSCRVCICGWVELLAEEYTAALFLVEKQEKPGSRPFTYKNIELPDTVLQKIKFGK